MQIYINEEPIDFTLEGEQTLAEVLGGVYSWLQKEGFIPSAVRINGRAVDPSADLSHQSVDDIQRIDVEVVRSADLPRELLTTIHRYLALVHRTLSSGRSAGANSSAAPREAAREALAEYGFVRDSLRGFLTEIMGQAGGEHFERLDTALAALADRSDPAAAVDNETMEALQRTIALCKTRLSELENPERELGAVMGLVHGMLDDVRDVPVQLQTGKDPEAMQTVVRFTELTAKMLRLLPSMPNLRTLVVDEKPIDDHIQGLNEILGELTEAFAAEDAILIGDLLEYEIVERIESLIDAVNRPT